MSNKVFSAFLTVGFLVGLTAGANAAVLPYSYTTSDISKAGNLDLQSIAPNKSLFGTYKLGAHTLTVDNAAVVSHDVYPDPGVMLPHLRPTGVAETENYLTVFGPEPINHDGTATFNLADGVTNFSFLWGSIDTYNRLIVTNGAGMTYDIYGLDLIAGLLAPMHATKYFSLTDLTGIKQVVLTGTWHGFEAARFSAVPLPAALPLFGTALVGLAALRRRKTQG